MFSNEIKIENLKIFAHHGLYAQEKNGQNFILNITLGLNFNQAAKFDNLNCTINYDKFCKFVELVFVKFRFKLLESAAKFLTEQILLKFDKLKFVVVEISKERAVFKSNCAVKCVKVKMVNCWHTAYLGLGSNLGKRLKNLLVSINLFKLEPKIKIVKVSTIFKNKAYGRVMADFYNCVIKLKTLFNPFELLEFGFEIEKKLSRVRLVKWGPRTIDVDILFFDNLILNTRNLIIPHPEILNRSFVLNPMAELAPYFIHPTVNKNMLELASALNKK